MRPVTSLKLSNDRKVSPLSRWAKGNKRWEPKVANSFGLPAGKQGSCPGATDWCTAICYADKLQNAWSTVDRLVNHNLSLLKACGSNVSRMATLLTEMVDSVNWHGTDPVFRIHWDGDFYSKAYAAAWAKVCHSRPNVQFWSYTRSFDYVPLLVNVPNLTLYLSVDPSNALKAKKAYQAHPSLLIAACADTWDETETLMRTLTGRNAPACPELKGKVPLVTSQGVGACVACGLCIRGTNHVRFASKH